jgi:hypothetical protein
MPEAVFACPICSTTFPVEDGTSERAETCPGCASQLKAFFFPALFRPREVGIAASAVADPSEASCFYHPQKQAARVCDSCGRMICSLCSIDMGVEHLCPACISSGRKKAKLSTLENSRTCYDNIALALAVASLFMSFLALIMSPAAIYIALRHWNSPGRVQGRDSSRLRFVIAIGLALVSLVIWGGILGLAIFGAGLKHPVHQR